VQVCYEKFDIAADTSFEKTDPGETRNNKAKKISGRREVMRLLVSFKLNTAAVGTFHNRGANTTVLGKSQERGDNPM